MHKKRVPTALRWFFFVLGTGTMISAGIYLKAYIAGGTILGEGLRAPPQAPITPGSMGPGVPAIRGGAWRLHVRADTRRIPGRNWQTRRIWGLPLYFTQVTGVWVSGSAGL